MASEAASRSSASSVHNTDILQRMAHGPVNLAKVPSAMGRGPILENDVESGLRLEDIGGDTRRVTDGQDHHGKTSDDTRSKCHRGN